MLDEMGLDGMALNHLYKALPTAIPVSGPPPVSIISPYAISTTLTSAHEQYGGLAMSCKSVPSAN